MEQGEKKVQIVTDGLNERIVRLGLVNKDLTPLTYGSRTITPLGLTFTWFGMCITVAGFLTAGAYMQWITVGEALMACIVGKFLCVIIQIVTQEIGILYGISYPTASRLHFGPLGSQLIAWVKIPSTTFWAGMNTWLGGTAVNVFMKELFGIDNIVIGMGFFAVITVLIVLKGAEILNKFNGIVSPVLIVIFIYFGYLLFQNAHASLSEILTFTNAETTLPFIEKVDRWGVCCMAVMGGMFGLSLAMPNISRECTGNPLKFNSWWETNKWFAVAEFFGGVPITLALNFLGCSSACITGVINPITAIEMTVGEESKVIMLLIQVFIMLAIWSTTAGVNVLTTALLLCNIFKKVPYKVMSCIFLACAIAIRPWRITGALPTIVSWLGGIQAPLGGMIITDYFLVRKRRIELEDLYKTKGSKYYYWKGINPASIVTYIVTILFMQIPALRAYNIMVGMFISSPLYYFLMKFWIFKKYPENKEDAKKRFPDSLEEAEAIDKKINEELGFYADVEQAAVEAK